MTQNKPTAERKDYIIVDATGKRHKPLVAFSMTQDLANRISAMLGSAHMQSLTADENKAWIDGQRGDPFLVRYKPPAKAAARTRPKSKSKGGSLGDWNRLIQEQGQK